MIFEGFTVPLLTELGDRPEFIPAYLGVAIGVIGVHHFLHLRPLSGFLQRRVRKHLEVGVSEFPQVQQSILWLSVEHPEVIITNSLEVSQRHAWDDLGQHHFPVRYWRGCGLALRSRLRLWGVVRSVPTIEAESTRRLSFVHNGKPSVHERTLA